MERAVFAAADKSIFALDKRAAGPQRPDQDKAMGPPTVDCGLWTVDPGAAVKDKVSGIMLMGTLKAETSTPSGPGQGHGPGHGQMQMQMLVRQRQQQQQQRFLLVKLPL
ncbi:hypothetical protein KR222_006570, partial [Zaprionus bogoriensis]